MWGRELSIDIDNMSSSDIQQRRSSRLFVYGVLDPKDELDEVRPAEVLAVCID